MFQIWIECRDPNNVTNLDFVHEHFLGENVAKRKGVLKIVVVTIVKVERFENIITDCLEKILSLHAFLWF